MRVIVSSSPTGGHLFPAIMVAEELRNTGQEVLFAGSFGLGTGWIRTAGFRFEEIPSRPFTDIFSVVAMGKAVSMAMDILKRFSPNVVIGFGGYGAFPMITAASLSNCPCLIHEQNVVVGRANALMAKFVKRIAVSFKDSLEYFPKKKRVLTGCPYHIIPENLSRQDAFKFLGLSSEKKITLLVIGGSQGSSRINKDFVLSAELLKKDVDIQVIHISGKNDYEYLKDAYTRLDIPVRLFTFLDEIWYAYLAADIVVSRAGAATIFEIAGARLPAVLIPYPYAVKSHQDKNAAVLRDLGSTEVISEEELSPQLLRDAILNLLLYRGNAMEMEKRFKQLCIPDAARRIGEEALSIARDR